jgi:hypothetical protein
LREAFLLQMNDFDRILELMLRNLLDPVVASQPPARRGRLDRRQGSAVVVEPIGIELAAEAIPIAVVEPVAVTVSVSTGAQL